VSALVVCPTVATAELGARERSSAGGEHDEASPVTGVDGGGSASHGSECDGDGFAQLDDTRR
jgi:hypothetical protein